MRGLLRFGLAAGVLIVGTGCNGFPRTIPYAEAEMKPEKFPTYTMSAAVQFIETPGQRWMPVPGAHLFPQPFLLTPIASGISRLSWNQPPYDVLFGGPGNHTTYEEVR